MSQILRRHDWLLNGAVLFLAAASLLILSSIDRALFWQQAIWFLIGFLVIFVFAGIDWRPLVNYRWVIFGVYVVSVLLLTVTLFLAPTIRSTRSWIVIGPVQFQTSEIAKFALIVLLSYFFAKRHVGIARLGILFKSFVYFAIPAGLILLQPDLGSTLIVLAIWFGFLLVSGIRWRHLAIGSVVTLVLLVLAWNFFLADYQRDRISAFLNPERDPLGVNYSVIQSKIAVGSGGFLGKGYGQGTQVQLGFLPAAGTDFIFASFMEEWGLLGGISVIGAFMFLLFRIVTIGMNAQNNFSKLLCLGAAIMFLIQFVVNMGSTLGLLPVIGVTFPFFSYGGSSILTNAMLVGIIQAIVVRSSFFRE